MKRQFTLFRLKVPSILLILCFALTGNSQDVQAIVSKRAIAIKSIEHKDSDYTDLKQLIPILKDVKILGIGESRHDDGATFKAKVRLVKFLREEMGFEVLAFESSFHGGLIANDAMKKDVTDFGSVSRDLSGWFNSAFCYPLLEYTKESQKSQSPLILAGFDMEKLPNSIPNTAMLINRAIDLCTRVATEKSMKLKIDSLVRSVEGGIGNQYYPAMKGKPSWYEAMNHIKRLLRELESTQSALGSNIEYDYKILTLAIRSFLMDVEMFSEGFPGLSFNVYRDYFMAKRVAFLTDSIYRGKKIILWAATGHLMRNFLSVDRADSLKYMMYSTYPYYQAGDYLKQWYGDRYYCIAFTSYQGEYGIQFPNNPEYSTYEGMEPIRKPQPNSFEDLFHKTGKPFLFFDLRENLPAILRRKRASHPLGYSQDMAEWHRLIDGFFFIDKMEPDQYRKGK